MTGHTPKPGDICPRCADNIERAGGEGYPGRLVHSRKLRCAKCWWKPGDPVRATEPDDDHDVAALLRHAELMRHRDHSGETDPECVICELIHGARVELGLETTGKEGR